MALSGLGSLLDLVKFLCPVELGTLAHLLLSSINHNYLRYANILDKPGQGITSFCLGGHGVNMDKLSIGNHLCTLVPMDGLGTAE